MMLYKDKNTIYIVAISIVIIIGILVGRHVQNSKDKDYAESLYKYKSGYIGNESNTVGLLHKLSFSKYIEKTQIKDGSKPYELIVNYRIDDVNIKKDELEKELNLNAKIIFSLIDNVDNISYKVKFNNEDNLLSYERINTYKNSHSLDDFKEVLIDAGKIN